MQSSHAKLAPSASHRWINCPGSIRMCENVGSTETEYAAEGTAAHDLAACCLMLGKDAVDYAGEAFAVGKFEFVVDDEMIEAVQLYVDHVRGLIDSAKGEAEFDYEQRLDMRHIHPDVWGTGDTVIYLVEECWLHVVDLKYGKGVVVEAKQNPQLFTYGAGAARRYHNRPLRGITLWIVQPRAPHKDGPIRSFEADLLELLEFEEELRVRAEATDDENAPLNPGDWCRFCPALATCPAAKAKATENAITEFAALTDEGPEGMTPDQIASVLLEADYIFNWVKAVQEFAHAEAVAGRHIPGFKLVAKRATRKWKDEEEATEELSAILGDAIYVDPKLRSPAQIEKLVGKKHFSGIEAAHVAKVSSGTNLVPFSDPRPAVKVDGMEEFADG